MSLINTSGTKSNFELLLGANDRQVTADSGIESFLPARFLAYTSGAVRTWQQVFRPPENPDDVEIEDTTEALPFEESVNEVNEPEPNAWAARYNIRAYGRLMDGAALRLAFVAVALFQIAQAEASSEAAEAGASDAARSWRRILGAVAWRDAISLNLRCNCSALNHKERKEGAKITKKGKKPAIFAHFVISLWSSW
jgi:hypothetical protein